MIVKRTENEVNDLLNAVAENIDAGKTKFRGMSYEQGIQEGINWLIGDREEHPYED